MNTPKSLAIKILTIVMMMSIALLLTCGLIALLLSQLPIIERINQGLVPNL